MNDITELAQRVEHIISDMKLKHGDKDTYAPVMKWDEFLALVEALEKAQETIAFQQGEIKALLSSLESRTVKLPKPISVLHRREFTAAHCAIYAYPEAEVNAALASAGIKVEAE
ncbi:hypothetical protein AAHW03_19550 [Klebsiella pneumoniae]|nr:hypothetical protein [Klebsiella pneumoniae]HDZ3160558.1 hypothetical protein [Klebsiella pneumoniae]